MRKARLYLATLALLAFPAIRTQAQTLTILHSFTGFDDGLGPFAGLIMDKAGNLYGTTLSGGIDPENGQGTVFKVDTTGQETVLHSFTGTPDGAFPLSGLIMDKAGNLYGTTGSGGTYAYGAIYAYGTVFKLGTNGQETVLYSFTNTPDGASPRAGLIMDKSGNLYGTTYMGGPSGFGTVFKLGTTGQETVLHSFTNAPDGLYPAAGLVMDKAGNLYGTTEYGGPENGPPYSQGTVFKVDTTGQETVLHSFTDTPDGAIPQAGLVMDKAGNLYGTTQSGGTSNDYGTVFKLDPTGQETVLYSFTGTPDGQLPSAGLVMDKAGNLYGTTQFGGTSKYGTVFKVDTTGQETVLYSFTGTPDGAFPLSGLVMDKAGNLYGTTDQGGTSGYGTVFKLTP